MAKTVELTDEEVTFLDVSLSRHLMAIGWFQTTDPVFLSSVEDAERVMRDILNKLKVGEE